MYYGRHIAHSQNIPTSNHDTAIPELVRKLADKDVVIFTCMLSQQRGPRSALKYARARERLLKDSEDGGRVNADVKDDQKAGQKVVVLLGGFEGWVRA